MGLLKRLENFFTGIGGRNETKRSGSASGSGKANQPRSYVAFDLEIAKVIEGDFSRWREHRPMGISCAAIVFDGQAPIQCFSQLANGSIADQMSRDDLVTLVHYLRDAVDKGWNLVTWNGLGFDFDVLAEESGEWETCRELALAHSDMMFHFFCVKGYPLSLGAAAKGMGLAGKTAGMTGDQAPIVWKRGEYQKVLEYVVQDVVTTLELAKLGNRRKYLQWTSRSGKGQALPLSAGWRTVGEAGRLPLPDTSWMTQPLRRDDFLRWTKRKPTVEHRFIPAVLEEEPPSILINPEIEEGETSEWTKVGDKKVWNGREEVEEDFQPVTNEEIHDWFIKDEEGLYDSESDLEDPYWLTEDEEFDESEDDLEEDCGGGARE